MLVLALIITLQGSLLFAKTNSEIMPAMAWPMQQGESLNDIARLFYPNNKHMQQQFVAATIKLNRDAQPNLSATRVFSQESLIDIPNIKSLSQKSRGHSTQLLRHSKVANVSPELDISAKLQADYESLVKRNAFFKQELENLNAKLAHLQLVFAALKVDLLRLIERAELAAATQAEKQGELQKTTQQTQNNLSVSTVAVAQKSIDLPVLSPTNKDAAIKALTKKEQVSSSHLLLPILSALFVISLLVALALYTRRQAEKVRRTADHIFEPLNKDVFNDDLATVHLPLSVKVNPVVAQSKFSDSIWQLVAEATPENTKVLDEKEEGELMLEQAKIYANLERYDNAIRLLSAYIKASPKVALRHGLYLLDIYRKTNQKEAFLESAEQLHQTFNVVVPQWEKAKTMDVNASSVVVAHSLEEYGYIVTQVTKLWADCEKEANKIAQTRRYLDWLLMDNRDGERAGFSEDVFEDIVLLRELLDEREKLAQEV